jgi:hypothetical protein
VPVLLPPGHSGHCVTLVSPPKVNLPAGHGLQPVAPSLTTPVKFPPLQV